ncbi:MAG: hypothetical protein RLZ98_1928 [Pseudomonadota bacterium]|jgi:CTP-dependent riboflavin kinase
MKGTVIVGRLVTGIGQGAHFTRLEWAHRQFVDKLGIDPYPGTINVAVEGEHAELWAELRAGPGVRIANPDTGEYACDARCYPVSIEERIKGAIVYPEVKGYAENLIEVIAVEGVRAALGICDGDAVKLLVE